MPVLSFGFYKKVPFVLIKGLFFHYVLDTISKSEEGDSDGK